VRLTGWSFSAHCSDWSGGSGGSGKQSNLCAMPVQVIKPGTNNLSHSSGDGLSVCAAIPETILYNAIAALIAAQSFSSKHGK
jgi:hypothetical protein